MGVWKIIEKSKNCSVDYCTVNLYCGSMCTKYEGNLNFCVLTAVHYILNVLYFV